MAPESFVQRVELMFNLHCINGDDLFYSTNGKDEVPMMVSTMLIPLEVSKFDEVEGRKC